MLPCFRGLGLELEVIRGEEVEQEAVVEEGEVEGGIMAAAAAVVVESFIRNLPSHQHLVHTTTMKYC